VEFAEDVALVVASPGIHVKSELELGCEELRRRGWKLLAVTGSKGKSSVVKVVADAINLSGGHAVACGNYGRPVCDLVGEAPGWAVVEVSSFMMETTALAPDTFEIAAILNIQEDHLDRHGSAGVYRALKQRLLACAKTGIVGEEVSEGGSSADVALLSGSYFDNAILRTNGMIAARLMRAAGLDDAGISRAFAAFEPLPHRFQRVAEFNGVECIDDSKATSLAALAAGLDMAGSNVRLIAGGLAKGDDPKSVLTHLTKRAKKVYLIGHCAEVFFAAWADAVDCEICGTMQKAVESAMRDAVKGDKILLSPGTASFDQFESFGQRGDVFAELVKKEGQKKT
jgi:UDP-N-acetylmuramoylalanine--D-glutamate ligase